MGGNTGYKRLFHIGGKRFVAFSHKSNQVEEITMLEMEGRQATKKLQLSPTRLQMLSVSDQLYQELERATKNSENDVDLKIHLGAIKDTYQSIGVGQWTNNSENGWK